MSTVKTAMPPAVAIRSIEPGDRGWLEVSTCKGPDGSTIPLSHYEDSIWDLSPYIRNTNASIDSGIIDFNLKMPDGNLLTDVSHGSLLEGVKSYLYVRWLHRSATARRFVSARTVYGEWRRMKPILEWMVSHGIRDFSQMTPERCQSFARDYLSEMESKKAATSSKLNVLSIIERMYQSRHLLSTAIPSDPWPDQTAFFLVHKGQRPPPREAKTKIIPRRLYIAIGKKALAFIEKESDRIINNLSLYLDVRAKAHEKAVRIRDFPLRRRRARRTLATYQEVEAALQEHMKPVHSWRADLGYVGLKELWSEVEALRTCCYVVCALFSGMRDSELNSLKLGAFYRETSFDGEEYCWLAGTTFKLEFDPKPARWMVPPVVEKAVEVASRLAAPIHEQLESELEKLDTAMRTAAGENRAPGKSQVLRHITLMKLRSNIFIERRGRLLRAAPLQNSSINRALKLLAKRFELYVQPEDMGEIRDKMAIQVGDIWPLASHQFRRTFALFVSRNMLGDLRYLREHFKHWSIDMTLYYAKDPLVDDSLIENAMSARDNLQASIMSDWITGEEPLAGGRADHILRYRQRGAVKTAKNPKMLAKSLGDGLFIRGTGHSWCLTATSGCGGEGLYDAIRCVNCSESVIDRSHTVIWNEIRNQQLETLTWPDLGIPTRERARLHLAEAEQVLERLGQPVGNSTSGR